jgi:glucan phosphoethanolaminetransferase (alkaline phosphatase superfamily)
VSVALPLPLLAALWSLRAKLKWSGQARTAVLAILIAAPLGAVALTAMHAPGTANRFRKAEGSLFLLAASIHEGFPFGMIQRFAEYHRDWGSMRDVVKRLDAFRFHAHRVNAIGKRQVYVLVIGESSRRDHWQLFGYGRPTNPKLSSLPNLILIPDMVTSWPVSIDAIPLLLTRKPITLEEGQWNEASILRAMKEAGFETWWISNQMLIGELDSPVSVYANEAQHMVFLNHVSADASGSYDEVLLQPLRDALHGSNHDQFIVLHMMGSHLQYDMRYPSSFKHFRPVSSDTDPDVLPGEHVRNSYDNTILYTDHILATIVGVLRSSGAVAAMWYSSDHGETLPTPICNISGHGIGSRYDYEVPVLFWYSDAYASMFPTRVTALRANAGKPTMSADTFESMIDMASVNFPGHDATWSLFSSQWRYRMRTINFPKQADIDHAVFRKPCDVVVPPNG